MSSNKQLKINWLLQGKAPTRQQVTQLKSFAKQNLKNMLIKGTNSENIKQYLKSIKALDKFETSKTSKKLSRTEKKHATRIIENHKIILHGSSGSLTIPKIKLKVPSKKEQQLGTYFTYGQIKTLEKFIKNKALINKIKLNNSAYVKEVKKRFEEKTGLKISVAKAKVLARQENLREYFLDPQKESLEEQALNDSIIGPIIEAMGG